MNVTVKSGAPTVAVVPVPESEMDALLLGRTAVRNFDQYVRHVCIFYSCYANYKVYILQRSLYCQDDKIDLLKNERPIAGQICLRS
ncbi:unnamed protein product [Leptosia nina]|uniref:Uncharacterized protein n=1 Tax=Leptosia nina TaxID=320188 RepID=A0AAV1J1P6_9NEOP